MMRKILLSVAVLGICVNSAFAMEVSMANGAATVFNLNDHNTSGYLLADNLNPDKKYQASCTNTFTSSSFKGKILVSEHSQNSEEGYLAKEKESVIAFSNLSPDEGDAISLSVNGSGFEDSSNSAILSCMIEEQK